MVVMYLKNLVFWFEGTTKSKLLPVCTVKAIYEKGIFLAQKITLLLFFLVRGRILHLLRKDLSNCSFI